jgi:predicted O-methyltransferase YrrM
MQFFERLRDHPSLAEVRARAALYHRQFRLDRALRATARAPSGPELDRVVAEICETWGDAGLVTADGSVRALLMEIQKAHGHILACGADLTTLLLALLVEHRGIRLWILESSPHAANVMRSWLSRYELGQSHVITAPADLGEPGVGYAVDTDRLPGPFSLVVCEASNAHPGNARRLLPRIATKLHADAVAIVRNVRRRQDVEYLAEWSRANAASFVMKGKTDPYVKIVLRNQAPSESHHAARINTAFGRR